MLVPRFLRASLLFAAGAVFAWSMIPQHTVETVVAAVPAVSSPVRSAGGGTIIGDVPDDPAVGTPPAFATVPKSAPGAGQKRALARALAQLERTPPDIEPSEGDPDTSAAIGTGLRSAIARLKPEGEIP